LKLFDPNFGGKMFQIFDIKNSESWTKVDQNLEQNLSRILYKNWPEFGTKVGQNPEQNLSRILYKNWPESWAKLAQDPAKKFHRLLATSWWGN